VAPPGTAITKRGRASRWSCAEYRWRVALPKVPTHSLAPGGGATAPPSLALLMPTPAAPKPVAGDERPLWSGPMTAPAMPQEGGVYAPVNQRKLDQLRGGAQYRGTGQPPLLSPVFLVLWALPLVRQFVGGAFSGVADAATLPADFLRNYGVPAENWARATLGLAPVPDFIGALAGHGLCRSRRWCSRRWEQAPVLGRVLGWSSQAQWALPLAVHWEARP
jgi:hypothetical protein